ncbi:rCG62570, partial [Rattus norvegicus]
MTAISPICSKEKLPSSPAVKSPVGRDTLMPTVVLKRTSCKLTCSVIF